jgi:hypothetical protein
MKPIAARACLTALLISVPGRVWAQQPATDPAPAATPSPAQPAAIPADPAAAPPVVRLPAFNLGPGPSSNATNAGTGGYPEFGLETAGTASASTTSFTLRTNRTIESRGAIPKVLKPERRGVGGFLVGFANLFNPLAPMEQGTGGATEYWYDGQLNTAPLPRAFQDERYHEAGLGLIKVPLDGDLTKETKRKSKR